MAFIFIRIIKYHVVHPKYIQKWNKTVKYMKNAE